VTTPLFSVIVPSRNRPAQLRRCIEAVGRCEFDRGNVEIIVVNDGGSPVNAEGLQSAANNIDLRLWNQPGRGPSAARNAGASVARGAFLLFIDDDCAPAEDWLLSVECAVARKPDAMHGGHTVNLLPDNPYSRTSQLLVDYVHSYYNDPSQNRTRFFASNNITVPAYRFARLGGFDESFRAAEDREFCRRWHEAGWEFCYTPSIVINHGHHLGLLSLQRQHFHYGRGALPYWLKAARVHNARFKVEPLAFYAGMLKYPLVQRQPNAEYMTALIFLSQVANAAGFATQAALELVTTLRARGQQMTRSEAEAARCSSPSVSYHGGVANETS
jgi:glycosyltransferase involved in cell wall biosynthesis